ncbi:hypothetical protein A2164_02570, partial [Candidatus Curtissbacteria bacterium RBG_13_35_7]
MKPAFTLIELLIVIAIMGILAAAVLVAINPGKRLAQARDAQRKGDINALTNALAGYYTIIQEYPTFERTCDTSRGGGGAGNPTDCSTAVSGSDWGTSASDSLYQALVISQGFLKKLPVDPINNATYYYKYEPGSNSTQYCTSASGNRCTRYWVGVRLESVDDPAKQGKIVFRCSDDTTTINGAGCKEVEFANATESTANT